MFLGHDIGWWGFWVGIAAIVLTVPLSMIGNILTPKVQNWWATRSENAMKKRIHTLRSRLADYESRFPEMTEFEDVVSECLVSIVLMAMYISPGVFMILVFGSHVGMPVGTSGHMSLVQFRTIRISAIGSVVLCATAALLALTRIAYLRKTQSPHSRRWMRESIDKLTQRLAQSDK